MNQWRKPLIKERGAGLTLAAASLKIPGTEFLSVSQAPRGGTAYVVTGTCKGCFERLLESLPSPAPQARASPPSNEEP